MKSDAYIEKVSRQFVGRQWSTGDVLRACRAAIYATEVGKQRRKDPKWDEEVVKGLQAARRQLKRWS